MKIKGTSSKDFLRGSSNDDVLKGGKGHDTLMGGGGADILKGGKGKDTFVVSVDQFDFIRDFTPGKDTIVLVDDALNTGYNRTAAEPLDAADFGTIVTVVNGVIEYNGAPVASVGDVGITYADLWLN